MLSFHIITTVYLLQLTAITIVFIHNRCYLIKYAIDTTGINPLKFQFVSKIQILKFTRINVKFNRI